jgi:NADH-quinone oxidoreductase subunit K
MIEKYLILAILLFSIGIVGVLSRRNIIIIYMSIELMLNAVNLALLAVASYVGSEDAHVISLMIIALAAAEAALFMALFVTLYRHKRSLDTSIFDLLGDKKATQRSTVQGNTNA